MTENETATDVIINYMKQKKGIVTPKELATNLDIPYNTIIGTLHRKVEQKIVIKEGRGKFRYIGEPVFSLTFDLNEASLSDMFLEDGIPLTVSERMLVKIHDDVSSTLNEIIDREDVTNECKKELEKKLFPIMNVIFSYLIEEHLVKRTDKLISMWIEEVASQKPEGYLCENDHKEFQRLMGGLLEQKIMPLLKKAPPKDLFKMLSDLEKESKKNKKKISKKKRDDKKSKS